jgi:predicted ester cyclase
MPPTNYDSTRKGLQEWVNAIPDYKATDLTAVADGDHVMVYGTWTGTWKNNMMGMNATKKSFKVNDVDIFKFNDQGRIVEHRAVQPMAEVARQIGMKMPAQKKQ